MACTNYGSCLILARADPAEQGEKLRQEHRRGAPDLLLSEMKCRDREDAPIPFALGRAHARRVDQGVDVDLENARHLAVSGRERRARVPHGDDRMKSEAADGNIDRRQRADDATAIERQRDLFVGLAESGLLECFVRLDDATWQ